VAQERSVEPSGEHERADDGLPQRALRVERDAAAVAGERGQHVGAEVAAALRAGVDPRRAAQRGRGPAGHVVLAPGDAESCERVVALAVLAVAQHALHDARVEVHAERRGERRQRCDERGVVAARGDAGADAQRRERARREERGAARAAHGSATRQVHDVPHGRSHDRHAHGAAGYGRAGA
jgi:hypothetical protein